MDVASLIASALGAGLALTLAVLATVLIKRRPGAPSRPHDMAATSARMARDIGVLSELLAERLAKLWQEGDGPSQVSTDPDSVYHHVMESTDTIMRQAGASSKAATAVAALTAKKVRPGPIKGPQVRERRGIQ